MKKIICTILFLSALYLNTKAQAPAFALNTPVQGLCFESSVEVNGGSALDELSKYQAGIDFLYGLRYVAQERIPGNGFLNSLCSMPLHLSAGLGIHYASALFQDEASIDNEVRTYGNELMVPLFLRGKIDFSPGIISPYIACDGGYTFAIHTSDYGMKGWFVQPQLGIDVHSSLLNFYLALGLDLQQSSYRHIYHFSDKYIQKLNPDIIKVYYPFCQSLCFHIGFRW